MVKRLSLTIILTLPVCLPAFGADKFANPVAAQFHADKKACVEAITSGDLAKALITTGSMLYQWRDYANFLDLARRVTTAYKYLSKETVQTEIDRRKAILDGAPCGFMCLDLGLMQLAVEGYKSASASFREVIADPDFQANPYMGVLLGRAMLECAYPHDATAEYEKASKLAALDPHALFRVRYEYSQDIFPYTSSAVACFRKSRESDYPLEQAWALEELINYAVAREDWEEARRLLEELELILPICVPDPTNNFERRRMERATMVAGRARKGLEGDRISLMDMHDEAMAFYWPHFECQKILKHMQPWTREFPLDRLAEWDDATGAKIIDAHIHTYSALHWCGKFKEAEAGHRSIISLVPFGRFPKEVMTAFGRLGNALRSQGRYEEAKEVYETCLELDAAYAEDAWLRELPTDPLQRTLMGGMNSDYNRYWHVANYEAVLKEIEEKLKEGGE